MPSCRRVEQPVFKQTTHCHWTCSSSSPEYAKTYLATTICACAYSVKPWQPQGTHCMLGLQCICLRTQSPDWLTSTALAVVPVDASSAATISSLAFSLTLLRMVAGFILRELSPRSIQALHLCQACQLLCAFSLPTA